jgi:hypothetical protein
MGFLKPDITTQQPRSQATPLATDVLGWLQSQFAQGTGGTATPAKTGSGGGIIDLLRGTASGTVGTGGTGLGTGLGEMQQMAGDYINQFILSRLNPESFAALAAPITEAFNRETDRGAAQLRESLGAMGNRFSSSLTREEGRFRGERQQDISTQLANMFAQEQANLLGAIQLQQLFGEQNIAPFLQFAGLGIQPEQTVVTDNPWMQLLNLGGQAGAAYLGRGGA